MIVIADDITGAAEVAGVAFAKGLPVRLVIGNYGFSGNIDVEPAMTVIATDTRSMSEAEAIAETRRIASSLPSFGETGGNCLFKKTDSALRGHVVAELVALMQATGCCRAVYLPANPSKGRIIRDGIYYIREEGVEKPIAETAFSYDPEFPARTSSLRERFPDAGTNGIIMPDAVTTDDIDSIVTCYNDGQTLFAGAADVFSSLSPHTSHLTPLTSLPRRKAPQSLPPRNCLSPLTPTLIVCGSTQSRPDVFGLPVSAMPLDIYEGSDDLTSWFDDTLPKYVAGPLVLSIPHHHLTGKAVAMHLRRQTARLVAFLFSHHRPQELCIEGGATAFAVLDVLGIQSLQVIAQPNPGVVRMQTDDGLIVTLKPGSYAWGSNDLLFRNK